MQNLCKIIEQVKFLTYYYHNTAIQWQVESAYIWIFTTQSQYLSKGETKLIIKSSILAANRAYQMPS